MLGPGRLRPPPALRLRALGVAVLVLWAGRNVVLQGIATYGPGAPPPPWSAASAGNEIDPLQGVLVALAGRLPDDAEVTLVAPATTRQRSYYWATYFLYPRPVRLFDGPAAGTRAIVVLTAGTPPSAPPGYETVALRHSGDDWYAAFVPIDAAPAAVRR